MTSMITEGVQVSVETFYQEDYSNPMQGEYMFAYRVEIENYNSFPVQLHRRHWFIFDSNATRREVEGEGGRDTTGDSSRRNVSLCEWL